MMENDDEFNAFNNLMKTCPEAALDLATAIIFSGSR
jgi:hypothetical protein